jgi:hypothetical protein
MPFDLSKQRWAMFIATSPFLAGMLYLAVRNAAGSAEPAVADTRVVTFKVYFDDRVRFPEKIRQSTIKMMLGPGFEIVDGHRSVELPAVRSHSEKERDRDCQIHHQGGLLALRVPQRAVTADVAARLSQLARIKTVIIYMNE